MSNRNVFGEFGLNADNPAGDAYGRLRVSSPFPVFESKQLFDNQPLFWDEKLESGAGITSAFDINNAATVLTSTANTAGKFTRQTFIHFNYRSGKSQLIYLTGNVSFSGGGTGVSRKMGQFDDDDGIYVELLEDTPFVVLRSSSSGSVVEQRIPQEDWNLDTLDGGLGSSNKSRIQLAQVNSQIVVIDYEWLSVGRVRIGFIINGVITYVHEFLNANSNPGAYMATANLPLRYQMETTTDSPVAQQLCSCATIITEGGEGTLGIQRYKSTEGTALDAAVSGESYALMGIRLKGTHIGAALEVIRANIQLQTGGRKMEWCLVANPTVAGTFTYNDETNSAAQIAIGVTANTVTGGTVIDGGFVETSTGGLESGSSSKDIDTLGYKPGASISDVVDEWVLVVRPVGLGSNFEVEGALGWRELS